MIHSYISNLIIYKYHYPVLVSISNIIPKKKYHGRSSIDPYDPMVSMVMEHAAAPVLSEHRTFIEAISSSAVRCVTMPPSSDISWRFEGFEGPKVTSFLVTKSCLHFLEHGDISLKINKICHMIMKKYYEKRMMQK